MMKPPRRIFRARAHGTDTVVLNEVGRPELPEVNAFINAHRGNFRVGEVAMLEVSHDASCRYPSGGRCSCAAGPDVSITRRISS
jgi:hypothetical protein